MDNSGLSPARRRLWPWLLGSFAGGLMAGVVPTWIAMRPDVPAAQVGSHAVPPVATPVPVKLKTGEGTGALRLVVPAAMPPGYRLPLDYTCYHAGQSPALSWSGAPTGTRSFVVLMMRTAKDQDISLNWAIFDIPATAMGLAAGQPKDKPALPDGLREARNDRAAFAYVGPCEPRGISTYTFRLYALDTMPDLPAGAPKDALFAAMNGHVMDSAAAPVIHELHYKMPGVTVSAKVPAAAGTDRPPARNPPR